MVSAGFVRRFQHIRGCEKVLVDGVDVVSEEHRRGESLSVASLIVFAFVCVSFLWFLDGC